MLFLADYSCKQASRLLSDAFDDPQHVGLYRRLSLRWHLLLCTNCTHYQRQLEVMREVMSELEAGGDESTGKP